MFHSASTFQFPITKKRAGFTQKTHQTINYSRQRKGFRFCLHFHLLYYIVLYLCVFFFLNYLHLHTRGKAEAQYKYNHIPITILFESILSFPFLSSKSHHPLFCLYLSWEKEAKEPFLQQSNHFHQQPHHNHHQYHKHLKRKEFIQFFTHPSLSLITPLNFFFAYFPA